MADIMKAKFLVVTRSVTYDIGQIIADIGEMDGTPDEETVLEQVQEWIHEDLRSPLSRHDVRAMVLDDDGVEEEVYLDI
jgi:hypothetical protein